MIDGTDPRNCMGFLLYREALRRADEQPPSIPRYKRELVRYEEYELLDVGSARSSVQDLPWDPP